MAGYIVLKVTQQELYCQNAAISQLNSVASWPNNHRTWEQT
jgi:hypothetical protein